MQGVGNEGRGRDACVIIQKQVALEEMSKMAQAWKRELRGRECEGERA